MPQSRIQPISADASADDRELVEGLRRGDEVIFGRLFQRHHAAMVRVASLYGHDAAAAEDVVQEAWLGVWRGIHRFEGRSSLKTWIFQILLNCARKHRRAEGKLASLPVTEEETEEDWAAMPPSAFQGAEGPRPGHFRARLPDWGPSAEHRLLTEEGLEVIRAALAELPRRQAEVLTLRDIEDLPAAEVCSLLELSPENQRVLLHRARSRLRRRIAAYFERNPE